MVSDNSATILGLIAEGRSYDQILRLHPGLTYLDIFAAAREALDLLHTDTALSAPEAPIERRWDDMGFGQMFPTEDGGQILAVEAGEQVLPAQAGEQAWQLEAAELTMDAKPSGKPSFIEKAQATHPRAFTRWTRDEDSRLRDLFARDLPIGEIGRELGRHNGAIRSRLVKLGLLAEDEASGQDAQDDRLAGRGAPAHDNRLKRRPRRKEAPVTESAALTLGVVPGWESIRSRLAGDA